MALDTETGQSCIFLTVASFATQQFVEIACDPLITFFVRAHFRNVSLPSDRPIPRYRRFTEQEWRKIWLCLISWIIGIAASWGSGHGLLHIWFEPQGSRDFNWTTGAHFCFWDVLISGLIIGSGTNGANSLLKSVQYFKDRLGVPGGTASLSSVGSSVSNPPNTTSDSGIHPDIASSSQDPVALPNTSWTDLDVPYVAQPATKWCWAAVGSMVSKFYNLATHSGEEPCAIAARVLHTTEASLVKCCGSDASCDLPAGCSCNQEGALEDAIPSENYCTAFDATDSDNPQTLSIAQMAAEIGKRRPIGIRIYLMDVNGNHFALITNMAGTSDSATTLIEIADPNQSTGIMIMNPQELRTYHYVPGQHDFNTPDTGIDHGQWNASYLTRPANEPC